MKTCHYHHCPRLRGTPTPQASALEGRCPTRSPDIHGPQEPWHSLFRNTISEVQMDGLSSTVSSVWYIFILKSEKINHNKLIGRLLNSEVTETKLMNFCSVWSPMRHYREAQTQMSGRSWLPFSPETWITLADGTIQTVKTGPAIFTGLIFAVRTELAPEV